jgi:hypothetical protein
VLVIVTNHREPETKPKKKKKRGVLKLTMMFPRCSTNATPCSGDTILLYARTDWNCYRIGRTVRTLDTIPRTLTLGDYRIDARNVEVQGPLGFGLIVFRPAIHRGQLVHRWTCPQD